MWYMLYGGSCIGALAVSLLVTRFAIFLSQKYNIYDTPGKRKIHTTMMPRIGWLGIYGAILLIVTIISYSVFALGAHPLCEKLWGGELISYIPGFYKKAPQLIGVLIGGMVITLIGIYDDRYGSSPLMKLCGQISAALVLIAFDIRITFFVHSYLFSVFITVVWVVALINAFNLLDNMDGLSGGVALIVSVLFFCAISSLDQYFVSILLAVFIGVLIGFLCFNFYPAKIFMGDAGSMFIGYFIAALTIVSTFYSKSAPSHFSVLMPLFILAVPIYDTASVILIRIKNKKPIYEGDTNHFSHRLVSLGMSHRGAVLFIYLVSLCAGMPALLLPYIHASGAILIFVQVVVVLLLIAFLEYFAKRKKDEKKEN
ncbi:MAG: MraY family glycosyltransferase [Candidatus Ancaeobacter aquaticus]|nr:MraY family glycosyltransferase [Candidatus Ancaeobacter aquaticus]